VPPLTHSPGLLLTNANVITFDDRRPRADTVLVRDSRILYVGRKDELELAGLGRATAIDCGGMTLVPGFIDAHCHVLAYASSLLAVDCRPSAVDSIDGIRQALSARTAETPAGQWVRGVGYHESELRDKRHPTRWDLDKAVPHHPVRLIHRSGHACILNSVALALVGISMDTPEPPGGTIDRHRESGEPTGLLLEMDGFLDERIPSLGEDELLRGLRLAGRSLASMGITSVQDATHTNSTRRWDFLLKLKANENFCQRITMMVGSNHLPGFLDRGSRFGDGDENLNVGAVKFMLTSTTGRIHPSKVELRTAVTLAREAGFQIAVHAIEAEAVDAAVEALAGGPDALPPHGRDRIEHCSESPPSSLKKLSASGLMVVTQPGFIYHNGHRYISEVSTDVLPWLYRVGSFQEGGLGPAFASDAPVIEPDPLLGIYAAVTRRAASGDTLNAGEKVTALEALRMYTLNGAYAAFQEGDKGTIQAGKLADLVLLDADPTAVEPERIRDIRPVLTMIGGRVVWEA
jgi:hypothetical protein